MVSSDAKNGIRMKPARSTYHKKGRIFFCCCCCSFFNEGLGQPTGMRHSVRQRGISMVKPSGSTRARLFTSPELQARYHEWCRKHSTEHSTTRSRQLTLAGYPCFSLLFSQQHVSSWCYYCYDSLFQTLTTLSSAGQEQGVPSWVESQEQEQKVP